MRITMAIIRARHIAFTPYQQYNALKKIYNFQYICRFDYPWIIPPFVNLLI